MYCAEYFDRFVSVIDAIPLTPLGELARDLLDIWAEGRTVFTCGNGGSAANASHFAQDLSRGTFTPILEGLKIEDDGSLAPTTLIEGVPPLRVICLCDNLSALTAWANDDGYGSVFLQQLRIFAHPGDLLIAISGSGNSMNVLNAVEYAKNMMHLRTWGICGFDGGKLKRIAERSIHVPCENMGMVEVAHDAIFHWLVEYLKAVRSGERLSRRRESDVDAEARQ